MKLGKKQLARVAAAAGRTVSGIGSLRFDFEHMEAFAMDARIGDAVNSWRIVAAARSDEEEREG